MYAHFIMCVLEERYFILKINLPFNFDIVSLNISFFNHSIKTHLILKLINKTNFRGTLR